MEALGLLSDQNELRFPESSETWFSFLLKSFWWKYKFHNFSQSWFKKISSKLWWANSIHCSSNLDVKANDAAFSSRKTQPTIVESKVAMLQFDFLVAQQLFHWNENFCNKQKNFSCFLHERLRSLSFQMESHYLLSQSISLIVVKFLFSLIGVCPNKRN